MSKFTACLGKLRGKRRGSFSSRGTAGRPKWRTAFAFTCVLMLCGILPARADYAAACAHMDADLQTASAQTAKPAAASGTAAGKPTEAETNHQARLENLASQPAPFRVVVESRKLPAGGAGSLTFNDKAFTGIDPGKLCIKVFWRALAEGENAIFRKATVREYFVLEKPPSLKVVFDVADPPDLGDKAGWLYDKAQYLVVGWIEPPPAPADATKSGASAPTPLKFSYATILPVSNLCKTLLLAILFVLVTYSLLAWWSYSKGEAIRKVSHRLDGTEEPLKGARLIAFFTSPIRIACGSYGEASISQLQIVLFTFIVAGLLFYLWLGTGRLSAISDDLLVLLGISAVGAAGAKFTAVLKSDLDPRVNRYLIGKGWYLWNARKSAENATLKQLLLSGGRLDVYKFQVAIFTVVVAFYVLFAGANDLGEVKISETMLYLIGISQGVYIGGKAVGDRKGRLEDAVTKMMESEQEIGKLSEEKAKADTASQPELDKKIAAKKSEFRKAAEVAAAEFADLNQLVSPQKDGKADPILYEPAAA